MPFRVPPSRIAQALDYLGRLRNQAAEFGGGVVSNLADRARAAGGLAYEALTTDPNIGRMTTAEFSQAAADRAPTPRLDQAARDIGTIGRAIVTQPVETGKAIVGGEIDRFKGAFASPQAAGEYAGSLIDPTRLAAALRHRIPISELDVYHGTPHRFPATEANPLGEFDASKIGTGEGAQAYGHGIYLAESPEVAEMYRRTTSKNAAMTSKPDTPEFLAEYAIKRWESPEKALKNLEMERNNFKTPLSDAERKQYDEALELLRRGEMTRGHRYKADLPDEMIDRMLDWDKPLSEQSAAVQKLLIKHWNPDEKLVTKSGESLWQELSRPGLRSTPTSGGGQNAAEWLKSIGIPGIKYLDAGSRGQGGSGTRNFVVFPGEEKKVRILERNGQPAPERIAQALEKIKPVTTAVEIPEALHGSPVRGLTELSPSQAMEVRGTTWFSDNADIADQYTFPREYGEILYDAEPGEVYKAGLSFKNPLTVDFNGKVGDARELSKLVEQAKKQGYDGLIIRNVDDSIDSSKVLGTSYAVFDRNQIKLKK